MSNALKSRLAALCCVLTLLLCALVTYPIAETGIDDDWSYVRSARVLAQTGHIAYNGWATAMLGWQLFLGAFFVKLFGPSFTSIRASTLLIALATAFLMHRTMVCTGISSRNASIGTLALVLSPLFLPIALIFMSDMGGLFCIVLCLYACLRAIQARTNRAELGWLAFAALSNAFGGTIRQIAWLGVLVMVPCAVWLMRHRPRVVILGALLYIISIAFVFGSIHWLSQQPYSVPESIFVGRIDVDSLFALVAESSSSIFRFTLLLLPILLAFLQGISFRNKNVHAYLIFGGELCIAIGTVLALKLPQILPFLLAPYEGTYISAHGLLNTAPIKGMRPVILTPSIRSILTVAVLLAIVCFLTFLVSGTRIRRFSKTPQQMPWNSLLILLVPFSLAYVALLVPRGLRGGIFDRYLLPLLVVGVILLLRLFQERVQPNVPQVSYVLVLLYAVFAVAGTHDAFSMYRARQMAISKLRDAGISPASVDGGFEHNSMTQIETFGYMNDPRIRVPSAVYVARSSPFPTDCQPQMYSLTPAIVPGYALSFDPQSCGGLSRFAPVAYNAWLGHHTVTIYVVDTVRRSKISN